MDGIEFDQIVVIEWYKSDNANSELEANDWIWNGEIPSTGSVSLYNLNNEIVAWSSEREGMKQLHLQSEQSIQANIKDIRKNFSGNIGLSTQIMCVGNPEWEDELEIGPSDIFKANDGDGEGSEISIKKQKSAINKFPDRLLCVRRNVYNGEPQKFSKDQILEESFWDNFEPDNDMERSAFIFEK